MQVGSRKASVEDHGLGEYFNHDGTKRFIIVNETDDRYTIRDTTQDDFIKNCDVTYEKQIYLAVFNPKLFNDK